MYIKCHKIHYKDFRHLINTHKHTCVHTHIQIHKIKPMGFYYCIETSKHQNYIDGLEMLRNFQNIESLLLFLKSLYCTTKYFKCFFFHVVLSNMPKQTFDKVKFGQSKNNMLISCFKSVSLVAWHDKTSLCISQSVGFRGLPHFWGMLPLGNKFTYTVRSIRKMLLLFEENFHNLEVGHTYSHISAHLTMWLAISTSQ